MPKRRPHLCGGGPGGVFGGRFARRLTAAFAATAVAAAALTAIVVNLAFSARFTDYVDAQRQAREQQVTAVLADTYQRSGGWAPPALDRVAAGLVMSGVELEILGPGGDRIWSPAQNGADPEMAAMHTQMMGAPDLGAPTASPVIVAGRQVGTALLRVPRAATPAVDEAFRASVNRWLLAGSLAAGTIALLVGLVITRRTTGRVVELTAAADALAAGHRDRRAEVSSADEIGDLAAAFNAMADTVAREDELRRGFAADIAHELRTPLAILRSQLEAVQDGVTAPTAAVIDSLHEETLRLGRLVADLETMADADAAAFTLDRCAVPLDAVVRDTVAGLAGLFAESDLQLVTDLAPVCVWADPGRLRQVITNLAGNAAKFTPPGGSITVTLFARGGYAELAVADTGAGIPDEDLPWVFERFFRGAGACADGSGIGLAVAAELVTAHGGDISVDTRPGYTRFLVRLPHTPPDTAPRSHRGFIESAPALPTVGVIRARPPHEK